MGVEKLSEEFLTIDGEGAATKVFNYAFKLFPDYPPVINLLITHRCPIKFCKMCYMIQAMVAREDVDMDPALIREIADQSYGFKEAYLTGGEPFWYKKDDDSFYYTYSVVWDADNDGMLELSFAKYDYPSMENYIYEVYSTGVSAGLNSEPINTLSFKLEQNYPNPFNPATTIQFNLNKAASVKIDIFNVEGKLVNQIVNNYRKAGTHKVLWNGTNNKGDRVASGTYFYRITNDNNVQTKKMLLIK